ncbi:DedA family protein [Salinarimonas sp.]|uniref:DedA family protein n=1 Tax=Salinarimonas sp. TaxID=2766526 RepID=UPI00391D2824
MESIAQLATSSAHLLGLLPSGGAAQAMCLALLAVAGIMTLERLVIVVPSAALLTGLGALAAQGWVDPLAGYGASVAGSIVGACAWHAGGFGLRRSAGSRIAHLRAPVLPRRWLDALAPGSPGLGLAIALAQCVPTVRLLAPMAAGLGGVRLISSAPFVAAGCAVWNGAFFLIGYRLATLS